MTKTHRIFSVVSVLLLTGCATAPREPVTEPVVQEAPPPEPDYAAMRLTVAGVGDIMLGTDYPENHLPDDDGISFLGAVAPTLSAADITFGNLEGVLQDGGEPIKECKNPNACYLFRSPTRYAQLLADAGFDVISVANNHPIALLLGNQSVSPIIKATPPTQKEMP